MRQRAVLPLVVAVLAACGSVPEASEQAAIRVPQRDLTLRQTPAAPDAVASPMEIPRSRAERSARQLHRAPKPAPARLSHRKAAERVPASEAAAQADAAAAPSGPAVLDPAVTEPPPDPRELAPGQTVTIIPTSSGPSVAAEPNDEIPSRAGRAIMGGRQGGTCRPRGAL